MLASSTSRAIRALSRRVFRKPAQNVVEPSLPNDAALSHSPLEHRDDFLPADVKALDQARDHPHVLHDPRVELDLDGLGPRARLRRPAPGGSSPPALAIESRLLLLPGCCPVVRRAPLSRALPVVRVPAAEGAAEVLPASVAGIGEEEDPAVPAPGETRPNMGPAPQRGPQDEVIRQDQVAYLALAIPARGKSEAIPDRYQRKPSVSLRMLTLCMLSSYRRSRNLR